GFSAEPTLVSGCREPACVVFMAPPPHRANSARGKPDGGGYRVRQRLADQWRALAIVPRNAVVSKPESCIPVRTMKLTHQRTVGVPMARSPAALSGKRGLRRLRASRQALVPTGESRPSCSPKTRNRLRLLLPLRQLDVGGARVRIDELRIKGLDALG